MAGKYSEQSLDLLLGDEEQGAFTKEWEHRFNRFTLVIFLFTHACI
jgi:hypothetical protein